MRQRREHDQHIAALFDRHLIFFGAFGAAVDLAISPRVGAEIVRRERPAPTRHTGVLQHGRQLRLNQRGTEQQRERRAGVDDVDRGDAAVAEILFGKEHGGAVGIGHQFVGRESLTIGERGETRVVFAAGLAQVGHQFIVEGAAAGEKRIVIVPGATQQIADFSAIPAPPGTFAPLEIFDRIEVVIGDHHVARYRRGDRTEIERQGN